MCDRHRGLVLLLWFPAALLVSAQTAGRHCQPPVIVGGFVIPSEDEYAHNQTVSYSCDKGLKPAVEGWWATVTCWNGEWSAKPECIEESSCFQPDVVPNTIYTQSQTGWYNNKAKIQIRCDQGYETKNNRFTATCINGTWTSMPVCERHADSCSEPPQLPHAVIINQTQQVFAVNSEVTYQCEDGYTTEQGESWKSVVCMSGSWSEGPTCKKPDTGRTIRPEQSDTEPTIRPVSNCGNLPHVPHSAVLRSRMFLTYSCVDHYKLTGPETVVCNSDGTWSATPTCEALGHCVLDPARYPMGHFNHGYQVQDVPEGETKYLQCHQGSNLHARAVKCSNGILTVASKCCYYQESYDGLCW